jgi:hypothetical protein
MAAAAKRGVYNDAARRTGEQLYCLLGQNGQMNRLF